MFLFKIFPQELIANACKAVAYEQSSLGAMIVASFGCFYLALSFPILLIPGFAAKWRHSISFSLLLVIAALLYTKFRITNMEGEGFFLVASEIVSGLTKRLLLTIAISCDPESTALGRLIHPYLPNSALKKSKKE